MTDFVSSSTENPALSRLRERIGNAGEDLSTAERAVCRLLASTSAERLIYTSATELGKQSRTSNASVVRTLQKLGYQGLSELKQEVAAPVTSQVAPDVRLRQRIEHLGQDIHRIQDEIWTEAQGLIEFTSSINSDETLSSAVKLFVHARTTYTYGLGISQIAAMHLSTRLNRVGLHCTHLDADGFGLADQLLPLDSEDLVVLFAPGRKTPEIDVIVDQANLVGARILVITDHLLDHLTQPITLALRAPHTPTGLTTASLAELLISDILIQGVASIGPEAAVQSSHKLNNLRSRLGYPGR